jgi:hypothetical protein
MSVKNSLSCSSHSPFCKFLPTPIRINPHASFVQRDMIYVVLQEGSCPSLLLSGLNPPIGLPAVDDIFGCNAKEWGPHEGNVKN